MATLVVAVGAVAVGIAGRTIANSGGQAPAPCARPAIRAGVVSCDGDDVGARAWLFGAKLDLNTASATSLARIRGIGPALAGRIVAHRQAVGGFTSVDDLDDVDGVGPKMLEKLKAAVDVKPRR